jgi:electron transfer flavoprotein alpha subunit
MHGPGDILVIAETSNGAPATLALELLGLARQLASATGGLVCAVIRSGFRSDVPAALIAGGADRVLVMRSEAGDGYESDVWLAGMDAVLANARPGVILVGHTALGADLAPRLAFRLKVGIATACEQVTVTDGSVHATRACYGNKAREVLALVGSPAVVTVKAKMYEPLAPDASRRGEVMELTTPNGAKPAAKVVERRQEDKSASARLENANVVVAGGRGLGGPEGFEVLENLASVLGGAVGASRVACDLGWCPHSWQIGLTGRTVMPELYIAVGISGASHHMAGCGNSKTILAINSDREAAIFKEARFGVVGDYREIVPALTQEIAKRRRAVRS